MLELTILIPVLFLCAGLGVGACYFNPRLCFCVQAQVLELKHQQSTQGSKHSTPGKAASAGQWTVCLSAFLSLNHEVHGLFVC